MTLDYSIRSWSWAIMAAMLAGLLSSRLDWVPKATLSQTTTKPEPWVLPTIPAFDVPKAITLLSTSSMWGAVEKAPVAETVKDPAWRIMATIAAGKEKFVFVSIDKQPAQQLRVGDLLPGGAKILDIRDDAVCLLINGKQRTLSIHPSGRAQL